VIDNWLVLDGDLSPLWVDNLSSMIDSNNKFTLANGGSVQNTSKYEQLQQWNLSYLH